MTLKLLCTGVIASAVLLAQASVPPTRGAVPWQLTFSDEFDGSTLEFPKWSPHDPWGHERNLEVQAYTPESIGLSERRVHIVAKPGKASYDGHARDYTSGMLTTFGSFAQMYGRFEVRARFPAGRGLDAKVWLLPVGASSRDQGEIPAIDIVEVLGMEPTRALLGHHWGDVKTERSYMGSWPVADLTTEFHTFAIEWDETKIVWFIDGKERFHSATGIPQQPMYLAMGLAVGGEVAKYPDSTTPFPALFELDYVRIYKKP